jgi:hypothetical protein
MPTGGQKDKRPKVVVQLGKLPLCWQYSTIFFANLACIFFGEPLKTKEISDNVMGFHSYGARLLPILGLLFRGDRNLLLLPEKPQPDLAAFFRDQLKLGLPEIVIVSPPHSCGNQALTIDTAILQRLAESAAEVIDGYVTDSALENLASRIGKRSINTMQSCLLANDKIGLHRFLQRRGLPVFDGGESDSPSELTAVLDDLAGRGYRKAAVRAAIGASGFGMQLIDLHSRRQLSASLAAEERLLVQGWIEEGRRGCRQLASPSVQFFCGENGQVVLYDFTDQLLSNNSVHEGNMSPPISLAAEEKAKDEILRQAAEVAAWISELDYRGPASVDFLIWRQEGELRVQVCEVNARVTGATYPSLLALHCNPGGAWLMRNMVFGPCMDVAGFLAFLKDKGLLFAPGAGRGILPINTICAENGQIVKCQMLFVDSGPAGCLAMLEEFPRLLPASCRFERD